MPMNQRTRDYVRDYKQRNSWAQGKDDERVLRALSKNGYSFPEGVSYEEPQIQAPQIEEEKQNNNLTFLGELLDYGVDETSSDFWKESYNRSLSSEVGKALFGKEKYDTGKYAENMNVVEDIGATVVSFMYPADVLAMKIGGKLGAKAAGGILAKTAPNLAKTGGLLSAQTLVGSASQAGGLATYEGAIGGLSAYNQGKSTDEILKATGEGVVHGGVLGAITGAIGQGMAQKQAELLKTGLWSKAEKAKKGVGKVLSEGEERFINLTFGVPGQIAAESGVFTGSEAIDKINAGEDLDAKELLTSFAKNVGLFGVLKAKGKLWGDTKNTLEDIYTKGEKALEKKIIKSHENVESELKKEHGDAEIDSALKPLREERKKHSDKVEDSESTLREAITQNEMVEKMFRKSEAEMTGNDYANLLNGLNLNIDLLGKESKRLSKEIDITPDGASKNALINTKGNIDRQMKEWIDVSKEYEGSVKSQKKEKAKSIYTEESILKKNKKFGLDFSELDLKTKEGRQEASDRINFELREEAKREGLKQGQQVDLATLQGRRSVENIDTKVTSELLTKVKAPREKGQGKRKANELSVLELDKIITEKNASESKISKTHKDILLDLINETTETGLTGATKTTAKFLNWVEKKYKANITELSEGQLKNIARGYIKETLGVDVFVKKGQRDKLGLSVQELRSLDSKAVAIYDGLAKMFNKVGLKDYLPLRKGITEGLTKPVIKGARAVVAGAEGKTPREAIDSAAKWARKQSKVGNLDGEGASLAIRLSNLFRNRSGEVRYFEAADINGSTGAIKFRASKTGNKTLKIDKALAKDLLKYINKKGLKGQKRVFDIEAPEFGKIVYEAMAKSGGQINVFLKETAELYDFMKEGIPGATKKGGGEQAGAGLNPAQIFRRIYDTESSQARLERAAQERGGTTTSAAHYSNKTEQTFKPKATPEIVKLEKQIAKEESAVKRLQKQQKDLLANNKLGMAENIGSQIVERRLGVIAPLKKQLKKLTKVDYQLEKDVKLDTASVKELERQIEYFSKLPAYKKIQINLRKSLGKFQGEQVLGRIRGHVIDIAQGKAKIDTIPHEISHHAVDILTAVGTNKSKALIKDGKRMFGSEEKLVQALGEYTAGRMKNRSMISRTKAFVSRMMSEVRNFFGVAKESDVIRILSEKVLKGKLDTRTPQDIIKADSVKFQTGKEGRESKAKLNKEVDRLEKVLLREGMTRNELNEIRKDYLSSSYINKEKGYRSYYRDKTSHTEFELYRDFLSDRIGGTSGFGRRIKNINEQYQITPSQQKNILETMGVREGNLENISTSKIVKQYESFVKEFGTKTNPEDTAHMNIGKLKEINLPHNLKRGMMPVYYVLDTYGGKPGKKLAQKIIDFDFIHNYKIKGQGDHHAHNIHKHLKKAKQSDNFWMLDERMVKEVTTGKDKRELTSSEKSFLRDKDIRDSDVYIAKKHYENMTKFMWESLMTAAKKHHNPIEFEAFKKKMSEKFVEDYMTRRVTQEALEGMKKGDHLEKLAEKMLGKAMRKDAEQFALKRYKKGSEEYTETLENRLKEIEANEGGAKDKIMEAVETDLLNIFEHKHYKVKNGYLMERVPVLPEFIEVLDKNGRAKKVKTYSTSAESIVDPYISGMSKYIATVDVFPEYTNIGGKYTLGESKKATLKLEMADSEFAQYAKKGIRRIIGLEPHDAFQSYLGRVGQKIASTSAAFGLSSPLSGLKNLVIGIPRSVASFGFGNTVKGLKLAFNSEGRESARRKGALEYGAKHLELAEQTVGIGKAQFSLEKLFKFNLMTETENINRIASMEAGKLHFIEQMNNLRGKKGMLGTTMKEGQVRDMMKDMWRLNNEQIDFIKKANFSNPEHVKKIEGLMQVAEHYSHVSAQGGTGVGSLPLWMSNQTTKPFLLFQRFATAITWDTYRNYVNPAIKYGNFTPLLTAAAGAHLGGALLYQVYEELFNTEPPREATSQLEKGIMYLHRAEFLGMFGELISPYDQKFGGLPNPIMEPVILRNFTEAAKNIYAFLSGGKSYEQALKDMTRKTIVVAAQAEKFYDNIVHPNFSDSKRLHTMAREFKRQHKINTPNIEAGTKRSPYYRNLREKVYFGTDDEIAKAYWAAHTYLVRDIQRSNPTLRKSEVIKRAHKDIDSSLRSMNPVNFSHETKGRKFGVSQRGAFLNWIKKNLGKRDYDTAIRLEKEYKKNLARAKRARRNAKWRNKLSVGYSF